MSVVPLTLTISLCLVFTFVLFFLREHSRRRFGSAESDSLLPLAVETARLAAPPSEKADAPGRPAPKHAGHECRGNGSCSSCQRRAARSQTPVQVAPGQA